MSRILFHSAVCTSAVLLIFVITLCLLSVIGRGAASYHSSAASYFARLESGRVLMVRQRAYPQARGAATARVDELGKMSVWDGLMSSGVSINLPTAKGRFGLAAETTELRLLSGRNGTFVLKIQQVNVACWFLVAVFAPLPALWVLLKLLNSPKGEGFCRECGYDLRATPDRCPECGTVPIAHSSRATG